MTDTSAYAPFNTSYAQTAPYLTTTEYQLAPEALDLTQLSYGKNVATNEQQLASIIARASSIIDQTVFGAYGTLNATLNVENGTVWGAPGGKLIIHPKFWPVLEVASFSYGSYPGQSASITPAGNCWVEPNRFVIVPGGVIGLGLGSAYGVATGCPYYCQWSYVNGWPNVLLTASVAAGATSCIPASLVGIYPGTTLDVVDAPNNETVTVSPTWTVGTSPVLLSEGFDATHPVGAVLTNLPQAAKQAAILTTSAMIKSRGDSALVLQSLQAPSKTQQMDDQGLGDDMALARMCIHALRAMVGAMV